MWHSVVQHGGNSVTEGAPVCDQHDIVQRVRVTSPSPVCCPGALPDTCSPAQYPGPPPHGNRCRGCFPPAEVHHQLLHLASIKLWFYPHRLMKESTTPLYSASCPPLMQPTIAESSENLYRWQGGGVVTEVRGVESEQKM